MAVSDWLHVCMVLFVVVDPVGLAPIFAALTRGAAPRDNRRTAWRGVWLSAMILFGVALVGDEVLGWLDVGLPAFRIAGGVLLFLLAVDMVFARQSGLRGTTPVEDLEATRREDVSVFPLAFPLIAGPGAITTILLHSAGHDAGLLALAGLLAAVILVLGATLLALLLATHISRALGETGANVVSRILGLVLAALAVQFILDGLRGAGLTGTV